MKMKRLFYLFCISLLVVSCTGQSGKNGTTSGGSADEYANKRASAGKTLEVLLAADESVYSGEIKSLIDSIFLSPQDCLPQLEPRFDLVNIPLSSYQNTEMFLAHRNIVILDINPENPNKVYLKKDSYAAPQVVFDFAVKDRNQLDSLIRHYADRLLSEIYDTEYRRMKKVFDDMKDIKISDAITQQFGFKLSIPEEYEIAAKDVDYAWVRKETKDFGLGVLIHQKSYTDMNQLDPESCVAMVDSVMKRVPGPADGSYMGTESRLDIISKKVDFNATNYCIETRGCWRLFGDFMGGPFVAYTFLSPNNKKVIQLVAYVYSPRFEKRDYLMQVDGICRSYQAVGTQDQN